MNGSLTNKGNKNMYDMICIGYGHDLLGEKCRVLSRTPGQYQDLNVEFEKYVNYHSCDGEGLYGHCVYLKSNHLIPISEVPKSLEGADIIIKGVGFKVILDEDIHSPFEIACNIEGSEGLTYRAKGF